MLAYHNVTAAEAALGGVSSIAKVSCSENDGPFSDVTTPTLITPSAVNGVVSTRYEWLFNFDPAQTSDGLQEIRCIIYPNTGWPLVLQGNAPPRIRLTASASSGTMTTTGGVVHVGDSIGCQTGCDLNTFVTASLGSNKYTLNNSITFGSQSVATNVVSSLYLNSNANGTLPAYSMYVSTAGNDTTGNGTSGNPYATIYKALNQTRIAHTDSGGLVIYMMCPSPPNT